MLIFHIKSYCLIVVSKDDDNEEDDDRKVTPKKRLAGKDRKTVIPTLQRQPHVTTITTTTTTTQAINPTPSSLYTTTTATQNTEITPTKASNQPENTVAASSAQSGSTTDQSSKATPSVEELLKQGAKETEPQKQPTLPPTDVPVVNQSDKSNEDASKQESVKDAKEEPLKINDSMVHDGATQPEGETPNSRNQEFKDIINQKSTQIPTSSPEVPLGAENVTEPPPKARSFGILKGFWRFHEVLAEGFFYYGQPVKGFIRGTLGFIGLGQV